MQVGQEVWGLYLQPDAEACGGRVGLGILWALMKSRWGMGEAGSPVPHPE